MGQKMKGFISFFLCIYMLIWQGITAWAEEIDEGTLYAKAAVLMDADSGRVLYAKNADKILPMASTTKIMTCILALENTDITKPVTISKRAAAMPDVQLNAKEGDSFYMADLLYSLMLESHNDSAVAIAEGVAGSVEAFADMMNQKAGELGAKNTHFVTPNGLDGKDEDGIHSTTAADLAKMMAYCVNESPKKEAFLKITQTQTYSFHNVVKKEDGKWQQGSKTYTSNNHNAFLHMMEGAQSGKTGFTGKAGYCYVGSLLQNEKHLVAVVLACGWPPHKTRKWSDVRKLMQYGMEDYVHQDLAKVKVSESDLGQVFVKNGQGENWNEDIALELTIEEEKEENPCEGILLKEGESIQVSIELPKELYAPVCANEKIGSIYYTVDEKVYKTERIVAKKSIQKVDFRFCLQCIQRKFFLSTILS